MNFYSEKLILGLSTLSACRLQAESNDRCGSTHTRGGHGAQRLI
jgi:hypothetical protein